MVMDQEMVPDPRLSFLFYCTLFFISGKINKYERQYKAACLLKLTVSSDPYTSTQTARPRPVGAWRGRNSGNRTWWPCIFRCCSSARGLPTGSGISFCSRRALRGSDSGNYSSRGAESCCFHKPSTLAGVFRYPADESSGYRSRPHTRTAGSSGMSF